MPAGAGHTAPAPHDAAQREPGGAGEEQDHGQHEPTRGEQHDAEGHDERAGDENELLRGGVEGVDPLEVAGRHDRGPQRAQRRFQRRRAGTRERGGDRGRLRREHGDGGDAERGHGGRRGEHGGEAAAVEGAAEQRRAGRQMNAYAASTLSAFELMARPQTQESAPSLGSAQATLPPPF